MESVCVYRRLSDFCQKKRNNPQPEGRQAKFVTHRTDYEGPAGQRYFSGNWVSPLMASDWANKGGLGSPQRAFAYFSRVGKVGLRSIPV